jgi:hypothetical protein
MPNPQPISQQDKVEWDLKKAEANKQKHGVSFETASLIFSGSCLFLLDTASSASEERWVAIGLLGETAIMVVYTERGERLRLISARRATREEREMLFRELGTKI